MNANQLMREKERRTLGNGRTKIDVTWSTLMRESCDYDDARRIFGGPNVDIHIPTYPRKKIGYRFAKLIAGVVQLQTYQNWTCTFMDDPDGKLDLDAVMDELDDIGIFMDRGKFRIYRSKNPMVYAKRNALIDITGGDVIANFDDDDYKHPRYLDVGLEYLTKTSRGTFMNGDPVYCLKNCQYRHRPLERCGSGQWIYWRKWRDLHDVRFKQWSNSKPRSDENFLVDAENKDGGFSRVECCKDLHSMMIRFRYGLNVSYLGWPTRRIDAGMKMLKASVDSRLFPILKDIHTKLL